jgi:dUTP pyrophosphatase
MFRRRQTITSTPVLDVQRLDPALPLPSYAHPGDAGLDLHASDATLLQPGERALVPCGIALAIPAGHVGLVHPRSGLALDHGLTVLNAPGTIDAGYRGEVKVLLVNLGQEPVEVRHGERIAQLLVMPLVTVDVREVDHLDATHRGGGGFGSTGR